MGRNDKETGQEIREASTGHFALFYFGLILAPAFALGTAAYVIATRYWGAECGLNGFLSIWLLIYAIGKTLSFIVFIVLAFFRTTKTGSKAIVFTTVAKYTLLTGWCIIAAIILFGFSETCLTVATGLWNMVLAILCIQLILLILMCLMGCCVISFPCCVVCAYMGCCEC